MNEPLPPDPIKITDFFAIAKSSGENIPETIFQEFAIDLSDIPDGCRVILSGAPDQNVPFIVDDRIRVNGRPYEGFSGPRAHPPDHIGKDPTPTYESKTFLDITDELRRDKILYLTCGDRGSVYCHGALYLRFEMK